MTRGKYGVRSALRREATEVEASEEAYRRQIVRLTQERDEARAGRDEAQRLWKQEVRALSAQLNEGTSARTAALTLELERQRAVVGDIKRIYKSRTKQWLRLIDRLIALIMEVKGATLLEAVELLTEWNIDPMGTKPGISENLDENVRAANSYEDELNPDGSETGFTVTAAVHGRLGKSGSDNDLDAVVAIQRARGIR